MNNYLEQFMSFLDIEQGGSPNTTKTYTLVIKDFLVFLEAVKVKLKKLRKEHIAKYIQYLREERKNGSKTIRLKIEALRSFLQFLTNRIKLFSQNPMASSDFKYKVEQKDAESISEDQMEALLNAVEKEIQEAKTALETTTGKKTLWKKRLFAAKRDRIILKMFLGTGLRISEVLSIRMKDVDFADKSIKILGKGKRFRQAFYDLDEVEDEFIQYIEDRKRIDTEHDYLFVSIKRYDKMTSRGFQILLKKYLQLSCLSLSISPHTLRHTFATLSIEKGANLKAVSQILGHANCDITIDLYTHLSNNHLRAVMQKCNPLSKEVIPIEERIEMRKKHLAYLEKTG